jgi:hypothetical protein
MPKRRLKNLTHKSVQKNCIPSELVVFRKGRAARCQRQIALQLLCSTEAWYGNDWNGHTVKCGFTETICYETDLTNASHEKKCAHHYESHRVVRAFGISGMPFQPPVGQQCLQQGQSTSLQSASKYKKLQNGIDPVMLLLYKVKSFNDVNDTKDKGKAPVKSLFCSHNAVREVKEANERGMGPVKLLLLTTNACSDFMDASASGMVPVKALSHKASRSKDVKALKDEGMVPVS